MKAADVMTRLVVSVTPETPVAEAVRLMLKDNISGLPVVAPGCRLVGIVTEGDFLRRAETGTQRRRPRWLEFLIGPGKLADEYVHTHGLRVEEVMTRDVVTITEDTPLDEVVRLMERRRIKRIPVVRGGGGGRGDGGCEVVGIVSRANLLHALAGIAAKAPPPSADDAAIRDRILAEIDREPWAPRASIDVTVRDGVVHLWGTVLDDRERQALCVAAENALGVKAVEDHLAWVEPTSGMVIAPQDDERHAGAADRN
jgi:CBS domain-containing protein